MKQSIRNFNPLSAEPFFLNFFRKLNSLNFKTVISPELEGVRSSFIARWVWSKNGRNLKKLDFCQIFYF